MKSNLAILLLLGCRLSCSEGDDRHLHDSQLAAEERVVVKLSDIDPAFDGFEFSSTSTLAWVGDTALAVVDVYEHQVLIMGLSNGTMSAIGRKGGGPGEFEAPLRLWGSPDGDVLVADVKLLRVSQFNSDREFVRSQAIPGIPLRLLGFDGKNTVILAWTGFYGSSGPVVGSIDLESGDLEGWFDAFESSPGLAHTPDGAVGPSPFVAAAMDADGSVLVGAGHAYRIIDIDASGSVQRTFGRPELEPEYRSAEELEALEENLRQVAAGTARVPGDAAERTIERYREQPKPFFYSESFEVDEDGRLWVVTSRGSGDSTYVDVFDSSGSFVQTVALRDKALVVAANLPLLAVLVKRTNGPHKDLNGVDVYAVSVNEAKAAVQE